MKFSTTRIACAGLLVAAAGAAQAADINALQLLNQHEFRLLSEDLGAAVSYKPLVPAESLGLIGFDVGVSLGGTKLANFDTFKKATNYANTPSVLPLASVRAHKGLPFDIDIGAAVGALPGTNVRTYGGEVRWALLPGSIALPAVAIRGSFSNLTGVDQLKLSTRSVDLSISKGFLMFTPYIGAGQVWVNSEAVGVSTLTSEKFNKPKVFAGVNINMGVNLAFETDKTGDSTSYGVKLGLRF
jgi:hypothetical protein